MHIPSVCKQIFPWNFDNESINMCLVILYIFHTVLMQEEADTTLYDGPLTDSSIITVHGVTVDFNR